MDSKKVVLVFAGHDPTGAAGIQADIESITAAGCQSVSIITALTIQNTSNFAATIPQDPDNLKKQCEFLLSDISVDACKIGLLGDVRVAMVISDILENLNKISIVIDPVLRAGSGEPVAGEEIVDFLKNNLLKKTTVLTPNTAEAFVLSGCDDIHKAGGKLVEMGCQHVLITGADSKTTKVRNVCFSKDNDPVTYEWERLPGTFHGSGCTLSASIAARIANGLDISAAIEAAQEYTWKALKHGIQTGKGQIHPDRFYRG